jgi:RNA polymerase sigma-70 factor (ECF subfamily)
MNALTFGGARDLASGPLDRPVADIAAVLARLVKGWQARVSARAAAGVNRTMRTALAQAVLMLPPAQATAGERAVATRDTADARFQRDIVVQLDAAYNFARFLSRDADAAQDIVQEAFLRAYRRFDGYQGGDPRAWVFAIVRNCYHDWLLERRRKARLEVDPHGNDGTQSRVLDDVPSAEDDPERALLRRSDAGAVRNVLNGLPRQLREILVLREIEGLSYRQIAEIAELPIGTVMSRLARARAQFQAAWRSETGPRGQQS